MKVIISRPNFNELDGVIEPNGLMEYQAPLAMNPINGNPIDEDNFYPAEGKSCACGCSGEHKSMALGGLIPSAAEMKRNRAMRQQRKNIRTQSKATARNQRTGAKVAQATAQKISAANMNKDSASDLELAKALGASSKPSASDKKGLSTGAKIGIGVGIAAVVIVGGIFIYKAVKKRKK